MELLQAAGWNWLQCVAIPMWLLEREYSLVAKTQFKIKHVNFLKALIVPELYFAVHGMLVLNFGPFTLTMRYLKKDMRLT